MNVAYILPYLRQPCGWRTLSVGVVNVMQEHVNPILFVEREDETTARQLFPGLEIFALPATQQYSFSSRKGWINLFQAYRAIKEADYPQINLVHSLEAYPCGLIGSWLSAKYDCSHVITANGTYALIWRTTWIDRLLYQRTLQEAQFVCPISNGTQDLMRKYFGSSLKHTRMKSILIGNNYHQRNSQSEVLNRSLPAQPLILTVGDIKPRKGQMVSVKAFRKAKERIPAARYWLIGDYKPNEYYFDIQRYIADHQVKDVTFFGRVSDEKLRECYQKASLFVLTPQPLSPTENLHVEGFGLVYLEAGAYGLPVIGSRFGGVPDAIRENETGLLVEPGDVDGIAEAILLLLSDQEVWRRMGLANRRWSEELSWERYAKEQTQVYQEALATR